MDKMTFTLQQSTQTRLSDTIYPPYRNLGTYITPLEDTSDTIIKRMDALHLRINKVKNTHLKIPCFTHSHNVLITSIISINHLEEHPI